MSLKQITKNVEASKMYVGPTAEFDKSVLFLTAPHAVGKEHKRYGVKNKTKEKANTLNSERQNEWIKKFQIWQTWNRKQIFSFKKQKIRKLWKTISTFATTIHLQFNCTI